LQKTNLPIIFVSASNPLTIRKAAIPAIHFHQSLAFTTLYIPFPISM